MADTECAKSLSAHHKNKNPFWSTTIFPLLLRARNKEYILAQMVELVDTPALEAGVARCESSSLSLGTKKTICSNSKFPVI